MKNVVVTGFGPYLEEPQNPSGAIAEALDQTVKNGVRIHGLVLPVSARAVGGIINDAIIKIRPDVLLITGVTPGRAAVAVERAALNVMDFPIPDIDGEEPVDEAVVPGGPSAYFSTLPIKKIVKEWRKGGIPSYVSNSAGTYVCNQTFYLSRHMTELSNIKAGLIHIPLSSASAAASSAPIASLGFETLLQAVLTAAIVSANHEGPDLKLSGGLTC